MSFDDILMDDENPRFEITRPRIMLFGMIGFALYGIMYEIGDMLEHELGLIDQNTYFIALLAFSLLILKTVFFKPVYKQSIQFIDAFKKTGISSLVTFGFVSLLFLAFDILDAYSYDGLLERYVEGSLVFAVLFGMADLCVAFVMAKRNMAIAFFLFLVYITIALLITTLPFRVFILD